MSGSASPRRAPAALYRLIAANAPLWAGEAEVFSSYFASAARTPTSDAQWLAKQCFKELIDGVARRLARITAGCDDFSGTEESVADALTDEIVHDELKHYVAFAIAYRTALVADGAVADSLRPTVRGADWPENAALMALRDAHLAAHGELGQRAYAFTEGGYGTLYRAGIALAGGGPLDDAIATACAQVYDDEWHHMLEGIAGFADAPLTESEWALLERLSVEQGRQRIRMRNAQFGYPLRAERIEALVAGAAEPLQFDFERAGLEPPR